MSKMDALRAMREARYEEAAKAAKKPATKTAKTPVPRPAPPAADEAGLCGHRAISGRTCTREAGHAAKSHRYA
jgi:hypothetical protein